MSDPSRMHWKGRFEFVFTSIGYVIGLGNIWRFPYQCYSNGGGVFLIPYFLAVILCVYPVLFLEISVGQYSSGGLMKMWSVSPLFAGVGWAIMFNLFITVIYYNVIIMYAIYYMLVSLVTIGGQLPWQSCREEDDWSTEMCRSPPLLDTTEMSSQKLIQTTLTIMNSSCVDLIKTKHNIADLKDMTFSEFKLNFSTCKLDYQTPEEQYWNRYVLVEHESDGLNRVGPIVGRNAFMLLITWCVVLYCCFRGIRSISRVIYVTVTFPFLLLVILLVLGFTLDGHSDGIQYYMKADWSKLSDLKIWSSAGTQAMYSIGIAYGSHIALASYNKFSNNVVRDSILIACVNVFFSFFCGLVVFSFLGHASLRLDKPIDEVFDQGPGILFISYIQGITKLPASAIWSFLFFLMVFTLGLDSQFVMVWTAYEGLQEQFPKYFKRYRKYILPGICFVLFLLGLPLVTTGGIHLLSLVDSYAASFNLIIIAALQCVVMSWVYGFNRYISDVESMVGKKSRYFWYFWRTTLMWTCPLFCVFLFIASAIGYTKSSYNGREIPGWGETIGILIVLTPPIIIIVLAVIQIRRYGGISSAIKPRGIWKNDDDSRNSNSYDRPDETQMKSDFQNEVFCTEEPEVLQLDSPPPCPASPISYT